MIQLTFSHKTQELVDLYVFNTWKAPWKKRSRQRIGFMIPLAFILFAIATMVNGNSMVPGIVMLVLSGVWLLVFNQVYEKRLATFAKGYYNHEINERFWAEHTYRFTSQNIRMKNEYVDATLQWKAIINYMEQDDVFWLFETLSSAHIIPKRSMSDEQVEAFRNMLASRLVQ